MEIQHIKHLLKKDILIEWRHKYAFNSAILYVIATVFISYLVFSNSIDALTWTALFWIIIVFATINTVSHSFSLESKNRYFYYYTISAPENVIIGKILYNNLLMLLLTLLTYLIFSLFFGSFIMHTFLFLVVLILGSFGLSSLLTMTTAIAWKAGSSFSLTAVLGFPLTLPLLIVLIRLTNITVAVDISTEILKLFLTLLLIDVIIIVLAYILFPYIWKD
ncbi:MAG: heme exporter protein CcmB [Bacteroidales bacterium]|nr:heme exporter protein CcmB [Bacteroidales bacterium]